MKIIHFKSENVKRLKAVAFDPAEVCTNIGGENGNGKSSVLDAVAMALGGAALCPEMPLRLGETEGFAEVHIQDGDDTLVIVRKFKGPGDGTVNGGGTLTVTRINAKGEKSRLQSPQAVLDRLLSVIAFDPLAFSRMKPAEQVERLKELVGINTDEIDERIKTFEDDRRDAGRRLKEAKALADNAETFKDAPQEPVSMADLLRSLNEAMTCNRSVDELHQAARSAEGDLTADSRNLSDTMRRISAAEESLKVLHADRERFEAACSADRLRIEAAKELASNAEYVDVGPIKDSMADCEAINHKVAANAKAEELTKAHDHAKMEYDLLDAEVDRLRNERRELMESAKWPITGLGFGDKGVELNGLPLEQASQAERIRLGAALAFASNPQLKIALVNDASLMDSKSWKALIETTVEHGGQVFCESVIEPGDDVDDVSVIIEDGCSEDPQEWKARKLAEESKELIAAY